LIFLGDIVDRGIYAYEVLVFLYMLKLNNSDKLFLNRGNHEEMDTNQSYKFDEEVCYKVNNEQQCQQLYKFFNLVMIHQPSSIIIENPHKNNKNVYLCHGGLPHDHINNDQLPQVFIEGLATKQSFIIDDKYGKGMRWNDIQGYGETINNNMRLRSVPKTSDLYNAIKIIGHNLIKNAEKVGINMIIRGHQDSFHNTKLMAVGTDTNEWFSIKEFTKEIHPKENLTCDGHIYDIRLNEDNYIIINNNDKYKHNEIIPAITISTNTDKDRNLTSDSYAILQFSKDDYINNCNKQYAGTLEKHKFHKYIKKMHELFMKIKI
jgi:hypothetical protein